MLFPLSKAKWACLVVLAILVLAGAGTFFYLRNQDDNVTDQQKRYHGNAVVSNGEECAAIGRDILHLHNGTAVDAAIAILFCEGVSVCQSMGLGGGFVATIYNKSNGVVETLIARERAPLASHKDMFANIEEVTGILAIAVPGELKGYAELHKRYGKVAWKTLIQPTIDLCRSGHLVTEYLGRVFKMYAQAIYNTPSLSEIFVNPKTKKVWVTGDRIKRLKLAETLEIIAHEGADSMYTANGTLARTITDELHELGSIITIDDFVQYTVDWEKPVVTRLRENHTLYSVPLPTSGIVLAMMMNIMNGYEPKDRITDLHRMIESFKFAYGKRSTLGDEEFNPKFISEFSDMNYANQIRSQILDNKTFNDFKHYGAQYAIEEEHGTAQMSVLSLNGDAISVTSTINNVFGSKVRSRKTGIIFNDEMDDFSFPGKANSFGIPPSPANYIKPKKRPLSSMCPVIILDQNNDVIMVTGSAGGSKITTSVADVLARHLWQKQPLQPAVNEKRLHHQLMPMHIMYEDGYDIETIKALELLGHKAVEDVTLIGFTATTAISRVRGFIEVATDPRRHGSTAIF